MLIDLVDRAVKVIGPIGPPKMSIDILHNQAKLGKGLYLMQQRKRNIRDKTPVRVERRKTRIAKEIVILAMLNTTGRTMNLYLLQ